ncbi:MAG: hypothetical protein K2M95_06740 [Clostridiales bacterium]|nr:hypothetical protein [Clostridiales bacterium]
MKKVSKIVLSALMAFACVLSFAACNEGAPQKSAGKATAIYGQVGHGNCLAEATVVVDGYGNPIKITLDDIFSLDDVCTYTSLDANAPKVTVDTKEYYEYIQIGDAVFQANANGKYSQIGVGSGITDFWAYYTDTESDAGRQMYYKAFLDKKLNVLTPVAEGTAGAVQLAGSYYKATAFNTSNGSMRKRYSKYWSASGNMMYGSNLGFNGNMEMIENYLLGYGFSGLDGNIQEAVKTEGGYQAINGVSTGATAVHTYMYISAAYNAYKLALENQKAL